MILRRFGNWMRSWFARHIAGGRAVDWEHQAVLIGAAYRSAVAGHTAPSPLASWLDDAHRLRPHVRLTVALSELPVRQRPRVSQPLRAETAPSAPPEQSVAVPPAERHDRQVVTAEPPGPSPHQVHTDDDAELEGLDGMDAERRRLVLLRYLVHQRVYNEGFGRGEMPEQYQPRRARHQDEQA